MTESTQPFVVAADPVLGMVVPGEPGYDCGECVADVARRAWPEGTKAVRRYCAEHGTNARPEMS